MLKQDVAARLNARKYIRDCILRFLLKLRYFPEGRSNNSVHFLLRTQGASLLTSISLLISFRCPVGKYWHYHGERCDELVSMPVDPPLIVTCLVGSLCLVCAVIGILIFINKKCINTRKAVTLV